MSYEPTTWANGDIITATKLNNIESGVQSVSSSYTPTTWVNGDIITATKLNNIEQGIANAGGGGGSSDFSTAEVTIINNTGDDLDLENSMPRIIDDYEEGENAIITWIFVSANSSEVLTGVLYQGVSVIRFMASTDVAITGNATKETVAIFQDVTITGDCTITIS